MAQLNTDLETLKTARDNMKLALEGQGQTVTKDIRTYAQAIANISGGGSGDIKLFDTVEHMQQDPSPQEGDLAVVYASTQANITEDAEFQIATFPQTVTLTTAVSDYIEVSFVPVESTGAMFDCWGSLDGSRFSLDIYTDIGDIKIQYTSQDGLTYTRTTFKKDNVTIEGDEIDFGIVIKFGSRWGEAQWDDRIGQFVIIGSSDFEGLFQYKDNLFNYAKTPFGSSSESIYKSTFYGSNGVVTGTLQNNSNLSIAQLCGRVEIYDTFSELSLNENVTNLSYLFNSKPYKHIPYFDTSNVTDMCGMFYGCYNLTAVPNFNTSNVTNMYNMFYNCYNLTDVPNFDTSNVTNMYEMFYGCDNLLSISNFNTVNVINMRQIFMNCHNITTIPNFDTSNVTDMMESFRNCYNITTIPNFDTSNVSQIAYMFVGCKNLISIPELDTGKATYTDSMFAGCENLSEVPLLNLSKVTSVMSMFSGCNNLSNNSYANIANMLPPTSQLRSYVNSIYLNSTGLNILNFTEEQKEILGYKGYVEAIPYTINTSNVSSSWNIYYE